MGYNFSICPISLVKIYGSIGGIMPVHSARPAPARRDNRLLAFFAGFKDHPASVGESYAQHFRFAVRFSALLMFAGFAAGVHAIVPPLFPTTASGILRRLHAEIERRH